MNEYKFEVRGVAVPQGSAKAFPFKKKDGQLGVAVNTVNPALRAWREAIATEARKVAPPVLIEGACQVSCYFQFVAPKSRKKQGMTMYSRPDLDKLLRAVLDACTGVIWKDDSQVCILRGQKVYLDPPGCRITIRTCVL